MAKDDGYELRRTLFEREIFLANDLEEEEGPLRRHIVKHGGLGYTWHEPLYRYKDGNHRVHERLAEPEELGNAGRVRWVSGRPGESPAYAGTDFLIARDGRIAAVYLFFDKLP